MRTVGAFLVGHVLGALVLATLSPVTATAAPAAASAYRVEVGLWESDFSPQMTAGECGRWRLDSRGFCTADDSRNGVELGMKFQSSRRLVITGVRLYRVDLGQVTGSLWDADGNRLATGRFADTDTTGWQDLTFSRPVTIAAGRTYVASYYSPATRYAFSYGYFRQELTRGPITALRAVDGDPNGVHCYDIGKCTSFPTTGYRDSGYWISPLWENPAGEVVPPPAVPGLPVDVQAPTVRAVTPTDRARKVSPRKTIRITFSEHVRAALLTKSTIRLERKGKRKALPVKLRYDERRLRVSMDPIGGLKRRTTYRILVSSSVVDVAGNRLDQDPSRPGVQFAAWTFRTR